MKIIYFYTGNRFGGVEKLLIDLFDYQSILEPGELQAVFVLCYEGYLSRKLRERGATVEVIPTPSLYSPWTLLKTFFQIRRILHKYSVNIVVSHEIWNHIIAWPIEKLLSIKSVLWIHSSSFRFNIPLYRCLGFCKPDIAICTSRHVRESVMRLWPNIKTDFLYPPYAKPKLQPKLMSCKKEVTLVYVGRIVEYKGLADIIEALGIIKDLSFNFIAVGEAESEDQILFKQKKIERAEVLGLRDKVSFVGFQENVFEFLLTADVFVHPNKLPEPLGFVFIEALFTGTPIVATNIGGAKEILEMQPSKMGDLVPPGDINALAAMLRKYIEEYDYRLQISENITKDFINEFSPEKSMTKLFKILNSL
ncbi:MAG: glycosyltransferase family 4 protein [Crocosphaera sp.]